MISSAIICLNEQDLIEQAIKECGWTDEIIIVDGGSVDNTLEIINKMKEADDRIKVYRSPFRGHFGDQKNLALSLCSHRWIFLLDADETLEEGLVEELKSIDVKSNRFDAVQIPRINYVDEKRTQVYPDYQYRFFRNFCRWIYPIHEELIGYRTLYTAEHYLRHYKTSIRYDSQQVFYDDIKSRLASKFRSPHEE